MAIIGGRAHTIEHIQNIGKLGYPYAEISLNDAEQAGQQLNQFTELKKKFGITYTAHYPNEGNPFDIDALREGYLPKVKNLLDISSELDIKKGTIHYLMDKRWVEYSIFTAKLDLLSELVSHATEKGIILCIENLTERYDSFSSLFDSLPELRMTLDIGHGELLSKENTSFGFIKHLFPKIENVHVHDNHGGKDVKDDLHLPLGEGRVDYPEILGRLKEKGYQSTITMEVLPKDMPRTKAELERYI